LSYDSFSLEDELKQTINSFDDGRNICKYPARYYLLTNKIKDNNFKKKSCEGFNYYLEQTNPKSLDLVFAAENVTNPSSMMGHVFFKINSKETNKQVKQNAVSFYTVIDSLNIPLLIYKSTIQGMKGYFILNPYLKQINRYLYEEGRSIWEYKLNLNVFQTKLILYHFWELKDINITYFFTGFNCATMVDDILSLTKDNYIEDSLWVTPKDVIKNAKEKNIIKSIKIIPSLQWELNMLLDNLEKENIEKIINLIKENENQKLKNIINQFNAKQKGLIKRFINIYSMYLTKNKTISFERFEELQKLVKNNNYVFDVKDYKNPTKTYNDSQASLYYGQRANHNYLGMSFLAASNTIYDDNREYFSENSLKIGEIDLRTFSNKIELNSLDIYSMKLLLPWNQVTKSISKEFKINYERHKDKNLKDIKVLNVSGGAGVTNLLHNDVTLFNIFKAGLGVNLEKASPYTSFETGLIIYEIFNMKIVLTNEFIFNQNNDSEIYRNTTINQSLFLNKRHKFDLQFNQKKNSNNYENSFMFSLSYFF